MTVAAKRKTKAKAKRRSERPASSAPAWRLQVLKLSQLRTDGETQSRSEMSEQTVAEYAERLSTAREERWPPLEAFNDGSSYWLVDGFHRLAALQRNGVIAFDVRVQRGSLRDAQLYSCSVNARHGLRRTHADKRRAILRLLRDPQWGKRADRWVAERCAVDHKTVAKVRAELEGAGEIPTSPGPREGQDGKSYPASQPSRPPARTVDYDGEGHPPEDSAGSADVEAPAFPRGPCGNVSCLCSGDGPHVLCGVGKSRDQERRDFLDSISSSPPVDGKQPASSPVPKAEERPAKRTWRETLGLPQSGPLGPLEIVAAFDAQWSDAAPGDVERRQALMRAKAFGLSQWHTKPELARKMASLSNVARLAEMRAAAGGGPFRILEPSAGIGGLCTSVRLAVTDRKTIHVTAHEVDPHRCALLRRSGDVDEVIEGDFLSSPPPAELFDLSIANTPSERGLDGLFLEELMRRALRIVVLLRVNALCGSDRLERVWSQVQRREWDVLDIRFLSERPSFLVGAEIEAGEVESDEGAQSDYCVVYLARIPESDAPDPPMACVDWWAPTRTRAESAA